ncbi:WbuC family cupin fold metalloprotein (plasmid) [Klebsiella pneumoniae]
MQGRLPPTLMPVMSSVDRETRQLQLLLVMGVDDSLGGVIRLNGTLYPAFAVPSADNRHLVISALTDKGLRYAGYGVAVNHDADSHISPGTYVRPHRHPHTFELLLPLRGRFVVLNFDDRGTVTHRAILGETCTVLEMAAGTWHAVLSLDTGGIIFEVKHGGYQPVAADDYAHWAPAEGEPGTTELMAWYAQAQVGDSTFAV